VVTPAAVVDAVERITGRDGIARAGPDWIPDHERRARRRRPHLAVMQITPEPPWLLSIRVLPVAPKRLTANNG
jgi:hypothetical protein